MLHVSHGLQQADAVATETNHLGVHGLEMQDSSRASLNANVHSSVMDVLAKRRLNCCNTARQQADMRHKPLHRRTD